MLHKQAQCNPIKEPKSIHCADTHSEKKEAVHNIADASGSRKMLCIQTLIFYMYIKKICYGKYHVEEEEEEKNYTRYIHGLLYVCTG